MKVVVGMSGGVDSSVAAYLLKKQGYDVIGATMQIWQDEEEEAKQEEGGCCGLSAVDDARRVAHQLGIDYYVMNFKESFQKNVIDYFVKEYLEARTPNPCIACNRFVKWESLLDRSLSIGADYIATGHYACVVKLSNGRYTLKQSAACAKDQTYALYNLTQRQLSHTLMPVGEYTKEEVRSIAEELALPVAHKPDSQEICFVPDDDYASFIQSELVRKGQSSSAFTQGNFVDTKGNVLGKHKGIAHYTIGQRKGLGIALGRPSYVVAIRPERNEVVLGDNDEVFGTVVRATNVNLMSIPELEGEMEVTAKIRYSHAGQKAVIRMVGEDCMECVFEEPVRAITPGQALVCYQGDYVVGGGVIIL